MSFAQEVKDFLTGYTTVREMGLKKEQNDADKAYKEAMVELQRGELDLKKQELELKKTESAARARVAAGSGGSGMTPYQEESLALRRAADEREQEKFDREQSEYEAEQNANEALTTPIEGEEEDPTAYFEKGGLVDEPPPIPLVRPKPRPEWLTTAKSAIPETPTGGVIDMTDPNEPVVPADSADKDAGKSTDPKATRLVTGEAQRVAKEVLDSEVKEVSTPAAAIDTKSGVSFAAGKGGMTPQEVEAMQDKVDPDGRMAPHLKTAATMSEIHRFFTQNGEPEKALLASKKYLVGVMNMSKVEGAMALEAFSQGDYQRGCFYLNNACNRFPSEHLVSVTPDAKGGVYYTVKDAEGNIVEEGRPRPEELKMFTEQVRSGRAMTDQMLHFAARYGESGGNFGRSLSGVEKAQAVVAGIDAELEVLGEDDSERKEKLLKARKEAVAALEYKSAVSRELGGMTGKGEKGLSDQATVENAIRSARKSGGETAIPYEEPVEEQPADQPAEAIPTSGSPGAKSAWSWGGGSSVTPKGNATGAEAPPAPRDAKSREVGKVYTAPDGRKVRWVGEGWELVE